MLRQNARDYPLPCSYSRYLATARTRCRSASRRRRRNICWRTPLGWQVRLSLCHLGNLIDTVVYWCCAGSVLTIFLDLFVSGIRGSDISRREIEADVRHEISPLIRSLDNLCIIAPVTSVGYSCSHSLESIKFAFTRPPRLLAKEHVLRRGG